MISEIWFFIRSGLPLWNSRLDITESSEFRLDQTLISGLLTASSNFTQEILGGKLKDLIMENELLHQYPVMNNKASFAVLIHKEVDIDQLDKILENVNKILSGEFMKESKGQEIDEMDIDFQRIFQKVSPPIFKKLVIDLNIFKEYQEKIHGDSFDHSQIIFLQKIPELASFLNTNKLSLIMRDITTRKTHLFQNYGNFNPDLMDQIENLITSFEKLDILFNQANLVQDISYLNLGKILISMFMIHQNFFIIIGMSEGDKTDKYEKQIRELKKKLETFIS
ncbi:MAG: hypothetical protein HeimC3_19090 [Candidatus Heimdallarchaeota archaeon LC_3]|nr:MAG: hypothetical protein HeimC3_19090 [Candidatus Heimdallarchaeota archaeon LC_3]